jgi:hypothetical protein
MFLFVSVKSGKIEAAFSHWGDAVRFRDDSPRHKLLQILDDPAIDDALRKLVGDPITPRADESH